MSFARFAVLSCLLLTRLPAQPPAKPAPSPLDAVAFLQGEWITHEDTELGHADSTSTFTLELDRHILIRRSSTKYTSGKNAGTEHTDLLIIHAEGASLRAIYFDNEGHAIHYRVGVPSAQSAVFESESGQPGPRYRLTHGVNGDRMNTQFEIATGGQGDFKTYVSGTSQRK